DRDRRMALFPFAYLAELDKWVPRDSLFLDPPREDVSFELDTWPLSCIRCHTTSGRFGAGPYGLPDKSTARTQAVEFGIACEACHGPGENHVLVNRNPLHRYRHYLGGAADETIVNPYELDHKRSSQVCGQCHSVQHDYREAAIRVLRDGFEYRPGDDLSNSTIRRVVRCCSDPLIELRARTDPNLSSVTEWFERYYWSDGMIRVSGREFNGLLESPCYEHGDMSCLTCHVMHQPVDDPRPRKQWANDQLKVNMVTGNTACVQCHKSFLDEAALTAHTHHDVDSSGSNCYNCHMSYTTYGLVKAIRSHQIDSPNVSTSLLTGRPNACNQCHLDRTLAWSAGHLADWYDLVPPEMSKDEQSIAASVLWLLRGDAGQRALMAWSYGWTDAQKASGTAWMAPYLAQLLIDPYDAVRLIAHRSLKTIDQYDSIPYDYVGAEEDRETARATVLERWRQRDAAPGPSAAAVLINVDGEIMENVFAPLLQQRDDREIGLRE
ncbi:MAG: C cytochrome precursor, partial [Fuerstiella sp.]